jgi:hypothetical protein
MATKVAIEVDIKTGGATDDIASLREELEKVKETQAKLTDQMKTGFEAAESRCKGCIQRNEKLRRLNWWCA